MRCLHCGTNNDEYARFCANCARSLASVETTSTAAIIPEGQTGSTQAIPPGLPPVPPRPNTLPVTDPRMRAVPPPKKSNRLPFFFLPVGFVCGLFAVAGAFVFATNNGGAFTGALSASGGPSTIAEATSTATQRPAGTPTTVAGSPTSGAVPSVTPAAGQPSPTTAAGGAVSPSPTSAAAQPSPTTAAAVPTPTTAAPPPTPTTAPAPARELKNTPGSRFSTGQTVWREGGGLTLQSTQAGIGTLTNPTARLTAVFVFTNEAGEPMNFPLNAGNFRVLVRSDQWRATNISTSSISTVDGASQSVTVTFTATGNLLQYQDVTTVDIVVDKFGPVEGVTFNARFR